MTVAHLHLLLNHIPTIGFGVGFGLLLLAIVRKSDHLNQASYEAFLIVALLTIPTYMSGVAAQATIEGLPDVSTAAIAAHQDAALLAFLFMEITGVVAWLGLWQVRRISRPPWNGAAVLLLSIVTLVLMANASNIGGDIRHPEIHAGQVATATDGTASSETLGIDSKLVSQFVSRHTWVWPLCEILHFVGLCLLLGVVLVVNLRLLGLMKSISFAAVHSLLPWGVLGFGLNLFTGMLFFIGTPEQYVANVAFYWKMTFVLLAGMNALYLTMFKQVWDVAPGDDAPMTGKVIAASAIFLWAGVLYFGRMLPYIGNSF